MANLTRRWSWKKWAPDIGENREPPGPPQLFLEIASGLAGRQMAEIGERLQAAQDIVFKSPPLVEGQPIEQMVAAHEAAQQDFLAAIRALYVEVLGPYVRVYQGPHTVDGMPLANLDDFLKIVQTCSDGGVRATGDLMAAVGEFNSMGGPDELFSRRSSGGARTTAPRRTALLPASVKTIAP